MAVDVEMNPEWKMALKDEFSKDYFKDLREFLHSEYRKNTIFPNGKNIFKALDTTPLSDVRVVILGQDPYHGPGQANGLCFSVNSGVKLPPSLVNIFKEIRTDFPDLKVDDGNLEPWAKQGVLLLNATLTVRANEAGSHQNKGWEKFTDAVVKTLNEKKEGVVYMLWGAYAQRKGNQINRDKNLILKSAHPSPLSAYRGFLGNQHFRKTNEYLIKHNQKPIVW